MTDDLEAGDEHNRFDGLDHEYRRYGLYCLSKHDTMALADLADEVAIWIHESPLHRISPEDVVDIYLSLYHSHVPALEDRGLVTYHQEQDMVAITDRGASIVSAVGLTDAYATPVIDVAQ